MGVAAFLLWNSVTISGWGDVGYVVGFFALSTGAGVVTGYARTRSQRGHFFAGLALAYAGSILAALCEAAILNPQLPLVEIDAKVGNPIACSAVVRVLIPSRKGNAHPEEEAFGRYRRSLLLTRRRVNSVRSR